MSNYNMLDFTNYVKTQVSEKSWISNFDQVVDERIQTFNNDGWPKCAQLTVDFFSRNIGNLIEACKGPSADAQRAREFLHQADDALNSNQMQRLQELFQPYTGAAN